MRLTMKSVVTPQSSVGRVPSSVKPLPMQLGYSKAWTNDGYRCRNKRRVECSSAGPGDDLDRQLQEDLKRLQIKDKIGKDDAVSRAKEYAVDEENTGGSFQDVIDKILIADFFFVLFALGWLALGVGLKTSSGSTDVLDAWLSLWQWVFQPAIGVLMLGAIVSGFAGWLKNKMNR
eukprot:jgi/Picsp_1/6581/NSC_03924-R1_protein